MSDINYRDEAEACKIYKRQAKRIAHQLHYDDIVIERIDSAKTTNEISRIMKTAREEQINNA